MDLSFLRSNRFYAAVIGILAIYLEQKGWIGEPEKLALASLAAVFVTIRTLDRTVEYLAPPKEEPTMTFNEIEKEPPKNRLPTPRSRQV